MIQAFIYLIGGTAIFVATLFSLFGLATERSLTYAEPTPSATETVGGTSTSSETVTDDRSQVPSRDVATTSLESNDLPSKVWVSEPKPKQFEKIPESPKVTVATPEPVSNVTPSSAESSYTFDVINVNARNALVNILCLAKPGSSLPSFTGSGIIIDPRGIILTNAHVAERMLLKNYKLPDALSCTMRNGSPARDAYRAELMYLPPSWIQANAKAISEENPTGTGEDDYAFLHITSSATEIPLPSSFAHLPININDKNISKGSPVLLAAYPAGFMTDRSVQTALYPVTSITTIKDFFTFKQQTLDLIMLGGNPVSQKGSSGGGVVNAAGSLFALIVTSTDAASTGDRDLGAITLSHISRSLESNLGMTLYELLDKDPAQFTKTFNETIAPGLTETLKAEYDKNAM